MTNLDDDPYLWWLYAEKRQAEKDAYDAEQEEDYRVAAIYSHRRDVLVSCIAKYVACRRES